ncbi:hypothetical protein HS125_06445 [bacterium]|nr:hypothetical protein [bacterium]
MEIHRALSQISEIHAHVSRGEVYRGFRSVPVGLSGLLALAAAGLQLRIFPADPLAWFIAYWTGVAALGATVAGAGIVHSYLFRYSERERRTTRRVVGQLLPALFAGVLCTGVFHARQLPVEFLPGLWAILFGLGIFAARPYLPHRIGWVGLYYVIAGVWLLAAPASPAAVVWGMGLVFGVGQLAGAMVLYWNLERENNGGKKPQR